MYNLKGNIAPHKVIQVINIRDAKKKKNDYELSFVPYKL